MRFTCFAVSQHSSGALGRRERETRGTKESPDRGCSTFFACHCLTELGCCCRFSDYPPLSRSHSLSTFLFCEFAIAPIPSSSRPLGTCLFPYRNSSWTFPTAAVPSGGDLSRPYPILIAGVLRLDSPRTWDSFTASSPSRHGPAYTVIITYGYFTSCVFPCRGQEHHHHHPCL